MADADIMEVACPCHQCRPEWFRNGWWCPQEVRVAPVPPPASLWPRFGHHLPQAAHGEEDSDFAPFDAELRAVLEASVRTAAADRRYLEELEQAISRSIEEAAGVDSGSNTTTEPSALAARCIICMEQKHDGIQCCCDEAGAAHFLCRECLPQYVRSELQSDEESGRRLMERRASGHCIRCPGRSQCEGFLQLDSLRPKTGQSCRQLRKQMRTTGSGSKSTIRKTPSCSVRPCSVPCPMQCSVGAAATGLSITRLVQIWTPTTGNGMATPRSPTSVRDADGGSTTSSSGHAGMAGSTCEQLRGGIQDAIHAAICFGYRSN